MKFNTQTQKPETALTKKNPVLLGGFQSFPDQYTLVVTISI